MPYKLEPITLEFPELGPEVRVRIVHPLLMPYGADGASALAAVGKDARVTAGGQVEVPISFAGELRRRQAAAAVLDWQGVCDPYTGEELPTPRKDPTVIDRTPGVVINRILQEIGKHNPDVPKTKPETSSEPSKDTTA